MGKAAGSPPIVYRQDDEQAVIRRSHMGVPDLLIRPGLLLAEPATVLLDLVEVEIAADRRLQVHRDPDVAGIGQVTIAEIAENLRRDCLAVEGKTVANFRDEDSGG